MPSPRLPFSPASLTTLECRWPGPANWAPNLGSYFDGDPHAGRDRDHFIKRSMGFVMLDEVGCLRLAGAGKPEEHVDPLKDGGVAAMTDGFDVDLDLLEAYAGVPRSTLDQQHAAGGDARQEGFGRGDLLTGPTEVRRLVDDELMIAHLVHRATWCRGAGGVNAVDDDFVAGHRVLQLYRARSGIRRSWSRTDDHVYASVDVIWTLTGSSPLPAWRSQTS